MMAAKRFAQSLIRGAHRRLAHRAAPDRVAIYFHALEGSLHDGFRACVEFWHSRGYRSVDAGEFVEPAEDKRLFLSFDDNFRSWHAALPLLEELSLKATFFVNTLPIRGACSTDQIEAYYTRIGHAGERVPLSAEEIRELAMAGHQIGCHSHSHFVLSRLPVTRAEDEILRCRGILEDIVERPVEDFSFPFGMRRHFSEELRRICLDRGFRTVCNAIPGLQHARPRREAINRSVWHLDRPVAYNVDNVRIDGRLFERLTGRSAVI